MLGSHGLSVVSIVGNLSVLLEQIQCCMLTSLEMKAHQLLHSPYLPSLHFLNSKHLLLVVLDDCVLVYSRFRSSCLSSDEIWVTLVHIEFLAAKSSLRALAVLDLVMVPDEDMTVGRCINMV